MLGYARADVEEIVIEHDRRRGNTGAADWLITSGRIAIAYNHPDGDEDLVRAWLSPSGVARSLEPMKIDGHYDQRADIAWLRFEGYEPSRAVSEETSFGLRELDREGSRVVALEYWRASEVLPRELLAMLPAPALSVTDG